MEIQNHVSESNIQCVIYRYIYITKWLKKFIGDVFTQLMIAEK